MHQNGQWLQGFVQKHLVFSGKCFRHCDQATTFERVSSEPDRVVGAYVCPSGAASQVVSFSLEPDLKWFQDFLEKQVGKGFLNQRDIRYARRHGWELGKEAAREIASELGESRSIVETYWTRYPRSDAEKKLRAFLCFDSALGKGCRRLFVQEIESAQRLCPECRA